MYESHYGGGWVATLLHVSHMRTKQGCMNLIMVVAGLLHVSHSRGVSNSNALFFMPQILTSHCGSTTYIIHYCKLQLPYAYFPPGTWHLIVGMTRGGAWMRGEGG